MVLILLHFRFLSYFQVYHKNIKTDKDMYNQMMDLAGAKTPSDGWLEREEYGIKVHLHIGMFGVPFCRRHFQMCVLEWTLLCID